MATYPFCWCGHDPKDHPNGGKCVAQGSQDCTCLQFQQWIEK